MSAERANSTPLADEAARRLARTTFDRPVILEAGAGTGKTTALVARLLAWLLDAGWRDADGSAAKALDGVVAITFTDAAAAEMAKRLADELAALAAGGQPTIAPELAAQIDPAALRERAAALGAELGRARILTIHAFCRSVLAAHPFEAEVHPAFAVDAEEEAAERAAFETVAARLAERVVAGDPDWLALLADGHDARSLFEATLAALRRSVTADELARDPFPPDAVAARLGETTPPLSALAEALRIALPTARGDAPAAVLSHLDSMRRELDREASAAALEAVSQAADELCACHRSTLLEWSKGTSGKTVAQAQPPEVDFLRLAADAVVALDSLRSLRPSELARARRVLGELVAAARERLDREGYLLYDNLLGRAVRLLDENGDARRSVRRSIRQLLVDEFQDTDHRQCRLVAALALDGPREERPGLFLVGDPKQSIYGWRDADLGAYYGFLDTVRAEGALSARLSVNFRSTPALLDEIARLVGPTFVVEPELQPPFEPLEAAPRGVERGARRAGLAAVEYWFSHRPGGEATRSRDASAIEASAVAADILASRERDRDLRWSDFALLARTASDFETYLAALRQAGIPFAIERDRSYWHRREVIDAAALVRAVIEPGDSLALVALLRSPFVGVPDAAWLPLWEAGFPERVARLLEPDAATLAELDALLRGVERSLPRHQIPGLARIDGWAASAAAALEALAELRAACGRESAERFVERLRARFALEPLAAARFLGQFGVANLERFFAELEEALEQSGDDPAAVARLLHGAVSKRRPAEEAKPPGTAADAVRIATIHRAKGLEFSVVYVVQAHKAAGRDRAEPPFEAERRGDRLDYRLLGSRTLGWNEAARRRDLIGDRERVRLLYVAATRAKDRLVVAGQPFASHEKERTLLKLLEHRWAEARALDAPYPRLDPGGVVWRAPAGEAQATGESARAPRVEPGLEDAAGIQEAFEALAARREEAAARAARPLFVRASDSGGFVADDEAQGQEQEDISSTGEDERERRKAFMERDRDRALARARGVALHKALELHALAGSDVEAWHARIRASFRLERPSADDAEIAALESDADRLRLSLLWKQLSLLAAEGRIEARELPILLASDSGATEGPVAGVTGTLDLLYRDPDRGELVVADFKSDEIVDEAAVAAKVATYRPQLELYGRAVSASLGLAAPPRLELWLLGADRIVAIR